MKSPPITRTEEEARGKTSGSISKGWFHGLIKVVTYFVIFIAGVVLGLSAGVHISRYFGSPTELFFPSTHYTASCKEEDYLKLDKYVNPGQLIHDMTDKEIFWRASMIPKKMEYPYKRVQKVAFMFLTKGALPFQPLWDKFFNGHEGLYSIYVHAPPRYKLAVSESSAFYGRHIPSQKVKWGSVEMVDAEKRLLANALLDFSNERFVLLSESCIPVYNFITVYKYLTGSTHSFADSYDDPSRYGRGRYNRYMLPDIKLAHWRKGSQWFEINRFLAVNMVADTKYYDLFRKYCKPSCYPDEHYLPTYLNMFFGSLNSNRSVTWVDWSKGGPHPAKFEGIDVTEEFIQAIRDGNGTTCEYNSKKTTVCYLFARKFDASALGPLMNFTSTIGNCVGAANHRVFIAFLFFAIISTTYSSVMSVYVGFNIWPPVDNGHRDPFSFFSIAGATSAFKEVSRAFMSSALLLSTRGLVLVYMFIASLSVQIGLSALLWQQLNFIYEGKTYLRSSDGENTGKGFQNLFRFFGCQNLAARYLLRASNAARKKIHEK